MRSSLAYFFLLAAVVSGFRQMNPTRQASTVCHAGYKGEDSAFQKQKAADEKKREMKRNQAEERKARGYTELKDAVGKKTFAKVKYEEKPGTPKEEKKLFGLF